jgi:hypothetical protein
MFSWSTISARTSGVAVAVSASTGMPGSAARIALSWPYAGRKSCPHALMQCASSMASTQMRSCASCGRTRCAVSGQTKTSEYSPASARRSTLASAWPLPSRHALTPSFVSRSTWSRASEMSGVTTRATPRQPLARLMTAGSM